MVTPALFLEYEALLCVGSDELQPDIEVLIAGRATALAPVLGPKTARKCLQSA